MRRTAELDAAHGRVAAALFACDGHPALAVLLRGNAFTGRTAALAHDLPAALARLWVLYSAADRALHDGAAIGLDVDGLPAAGTGSLPASRVAAADLVHDLDRRAAGLVRCLDRVEAAWAAVAGRLAGAEEALARAGRLAVELGAEPPGPLRAAVAEARRRDLADPVAAAPDGGLSPEAAERLDRVDALAAVTVAALEDLARFRDGYPDRAAALAAAVDRLGTAETGTARAFAVARAKIVAPGLPTPPRVAPVLRARLRQVGALARRRQWPRAVIDFAAVQEAVSAAQRRADGLHEAAAGLLHRRDELRGRLEAYRMKAAAAGLAEDDGLAEDHERALRLLYTAPCDLRASTRAVHTYRLALAGRLEERR
ncbi:MAG TPA: hypothetical protein VL738_45105 [Dactylosporangium sp.]|nr:hypothetical protein [Dactylosporangium sp.]